MNWKIVCVLAAVLPALLAQSPRVALLEVRLENWTAYRLDVADVAKLAVETKVTPPAVLSRSFLGSLGIADV